MSTLKILLCSIILLFAVDSLATPSADYALPDDLEELKQDYQAMKNAVNNPDLIWIPMDFDNHPSVMTFSQLEKKVQEELLGTESGNIEDDIAQYVAVLLRAVEFSKITKKKVKEELLPTMALKIKELEAKQIRYSRPEMLSGWGTTDKMEGLAEAELVGNVWESGHNDRHDRDRSVFDAQTSSFDKIEQNNQSDVNGYNRRISTADMQTSSFDEEDYYYGCPKKNPNDNYSTIFYQKGNKKNYRYCSYWAGYLKKEIPYVDGKTHGVVFSYVYVKDLNLYYLRTRSNYSNHKLNGIKDTYSHTKAGKVYPSHENNYVDDKLHGYQIERWDNGRIKTEYKYFMGTRLKGKYYNRKGEMVGCHEWDSQGKNKRSCM